MSQRDVLAELQTARVSAPPELRERVRLIAAADNAAPRRIVTWQRSFAVLVPVAAAVAAAVVLSTRPAHHRAVEHGEKAIARPLTAQLAPNTPAVPAPSAKRAQKYGATLTLRVPNASRLSDAVKQALHIVGSLGGYTVATHVSTGTTAASAELVVKVPRTRVQEAMTRLSSLGTITGESVSVQDAQSGINTTERTIAQLQRQLHTLLAQSQTAATHRQIAQLTARVVALQRQIATTVRVDRYATVQLSLTTPAPATPRHHGHGPLHGIGVAFRWIGIGLLYALAFGAPLVLLAAAVRWWRKRRVDALLSRS
jgi:hypothetical protein